MTRKATSKKSTARKATRPGAKAKPAKKPAARAAAPKKPVARSKRQKVFVVQQKVFGVYGDAQYTPPDRVFVTQRAAQQYADERNRELLALGTPFERFDVGSLIKGGDKALVVNRRPSTDRSAGFSTGPTGGTPTTSTRPTTSAMRCARRWTSSSGFRCERRRWSE
jgi:hypothetical protein